MVLLKTVNAWSFDYHEQTSHIKSDCIYWFNSTVNQPWVIKRDVFTDVNGHGCAICHVRYTVVNSYFYILYLLRHSSTSFVFEADRLYIFQSVISLTNVWTGYTWGLRFSVGRLLP